MKAITGLGAVLLGVLVLAFAGTAQASSVGWNALTSTTDPTAQTSRLFDVWADGPTAVAVGDEIFSGGGVVNVAQVCVHKVCTRSVLPTVPGNQQAITIGGSSTSDLWAFGTYGSGNQSVAWHYNGSSWSTVATTFANLQITQYLGVSANEGYATGSYIDSQAGASYAVLLHRVGSTWTQMLGAQAPQAQLPARCRSAFPTTNGVSFGRVVFVGGYPVVAGECGSDFAADKVVLKWDGTAWRDITTGLPSDLALGYGKIANVGNQVWVTDGNQTIYKRVDGAWSAVAAPSPDVVNFTLSGSPAAPGVAWVVGSLHGATSTWQYNGSAWTHVFSADLSVLGPTFMPAALVADSAASAYFVGTDWSKPVGQQDVILRQFGS